MKLKTFVITISKHFPGNHPKKGIETGFEAKISNGIKKHTIRGNYPFWKNRIDQINQGKAYLSIREWTGKPYNSKQIELFRYGKGDVGIEKCDIIPNPDYLDSPFISVGTNDISKGLLTHDQTLEVIKNDGLSMDDFDGWFKKSILGGCIIHFTDLRYKT